MASKLVRQLIHEIRLAVPEGSMKDNLSVRYILSQFEKYKVTDQQLCKAREEMEFLGNTYLCYLRSSRKCQKIHDEYHGKGERSVEETAKMVGFKLPHEPK